VSTGTPSHPTPAGIFSVIGKERFHRSNLYSNAPMPFMQRITWSGVALHQGVLPGYAASHGCIRLPESFAQYLWGTTRVGARVIITREEVVPFEIAHANLFKPLRPQEPTAPGDQAQAPGALKVAESDDPARTSDAPRPTGSAITAAETTDAGAGAKAPPGNNDKPARTARELSEPIGAQAPSPTAVDTATVGAAADSSNKGGRLAATEVKERPRMSDPVSVFISRKTGRLYVRQGFEPMFDVPVSIRNAEAPIGTHLYTALDFNEDRSAMRWQAVTLATTIPTHPVVAAEPERRKGDKRARREDHEQPAQAPAAARLAAAAALERVEMPKEAVERISNLLSPGASLIG
jgi:hypothetical protein